MKIILHCVWRGFSWLRMGPSGGLFLTQGVLLPTKCEDATSGIRIKTVNHYTETFVSAVEIFNHIICTFQYFF
jgi:hypothetical protein